MHIHSVSGAHGPYVQIEEEGHEEGSDCGIKEDELSGGYQVRLWRPECRSAEERDHWRWDYRAMEIHVSICPDHISIGMGMNGAGCYILGIGRDVITSRMNYGAVIS